jgi:hypothetical protein
MKKSFCSVAGATLLLVNVAQAYNEYIEMPSIRLVSINSKKVQILVIDGFIEIINHVCPVPIFIHFFY